MHKYLLVSSMEQKKITKYHLLLKKTDRTNTYSLYGITFPPTLSAKVCANTSHFPGTQDNIFCLKKYKELLHCKIYSNFVSKIY